VRGAPFGGVARDQSNRPTILNPASGGSGAPQTSWPAAPASTIERSLDPMQAAQVAATLLLLRLA